MKLQRNLADSLVLLVLLLLVVVVVKVNTQNIGNRAEYR